MQAGPVQELDGVQRLEIALLAPVQLQLVDHAPAAGGLGHETRRRRLPDQARGQRVSA